jgi:hypothetical protein
MRKLFQAMLAGGAAAALGAGVVLLVPGGANRAADHLEPPGRTNKDIDSTPDVPADIADVFAFVRGDQVILAMTFAGPGANTAPAVYDRDVLYKINVSTQAPADTPEIVIKWRYGPGTEPNKFGIQVEGLPGVTGVVEGSVEKVLEKDGVKVLAGLFDDPFFFDSRGFRETRNTGTLMFSNKRDFFAGQNDTAVIFSIPKDRFAGAAMPINVWGTTARFGGNI